ncbi:DnaJ domain-containing protein [Methylocystis suflitae]|uniref:DnaJ domain-containing protein n=1 Tax=Methylocystis suflitae TaxID=2951405 RepID=UPI00210AD8CA|nr:DnaJ domain-containing protein [Methylocystis suflitae]MCQ4189593.1 DnaJ domain-containing protein [Methylocystis suflitae]
MPILIGLIALLLTIVALNAYTKTSPALLAVILKRGGGFLALALGALLLVRGRLDLGMALLGFGVWLMGFGGGALRGFRKAGAGAGGVSRVRSAMIEMELDHSTGAIRGVVLAGQHEGVHLDSLARPALLELYGVCRRDDPDGARLLEAYLDRRFSGWRSASDAHANSGSFRSGEGGARRAGAISEDEAYEILGLKRGAAAADIARAHRDLMKKLHPDLGGTTDLAARVNEAKDVLMRRHQH